MAYLPPGVAVNIVGNEFGNSSVDMAVGVDSVKEKSQSPRWVHELRCWSFRVKYGLGTFSQKAWQVKKQVARGTVIDVSNDVITG